MITKPDEIAQDAWDKMSEATQEAWSEKEEARHAMERQRALLDQALSSYHAAERAWREADDLFIGLYCQDIRP